MPCAICKEDMRHSAVTPCEGCDRNCCSHRAKICLGWWDPYYGITYLDEDRPWVDDDHDSAPGERDDYLLLCPDCTPSD